MNIQTGTSPAPRWSGSALISWLFGALVCALGIVNLFWGNDPDFGAFILLLALVYVPPVTDWAKKRTGIAVRPWMKVLLAIFILWATLGVGELFDKIDLMLSGS